MKHWIITLSILFGLPGLSLADPATKLQQQWDHDTYQLAGKTQLKAFETLLQQAEQAKKDFPESAEVWLWSGIIHSSYAGITGGLGALKHAKAAKADLEQAIALDSKVWQGAAYTSLGTLYFKVPGWPLGFGDDEQARALLQQGLAMDPRGIDANYFYADYLLEQKQWQQAKSYLLKAQQAPARDDRPLADAGRQQQIATALQQIAANE